MKRCFVFLFILSTIFSFSLPSSTSAAPTQAINAPVLKWQRGGCYSSWCETGWYSSPAVADLDGDGAMEVIAGAYSLFILNGSNGSLKRPAIAPPTSNARIWPDVAVADLENDGDLEIITASAGGNLRVFDHTGSLVWSRQTNPANELRSLGVYDLDSDGSLEIMVASTAAANQWWVYEHDGSVRAGSWPQHGPDSDTNGYTHGAYNQNLAAADLTGDGLAEIIGPNDTHYIAAFHANGSQIRANGLYGQIGGNNKFWSRVGVHVSHSVDLRGYANCGSEHRPNFANSAPTIADVDNNGTLEIVVVGNVYNCGTSPYTDLYEMPFIFNGDRTRWSAGPYDWTAIPTPPANSAPRSEDYNVIESSLPNPVVADLDGDGLKEIIYPSYDGRMHAYKLDKSRPGSFPYSVYSASDGYLTFASPPAVADLDNNGQAELIFTTWVQKSSNLSGKLIILSSQGTLLQSVNLPPAFGSTSWNGGLAAPTLANIDSDPDLEVVVNSAHSGVLAYDLPGTAGARVLWGTGRGNYLRSGSPQPSDLSHSSMRVSDSTPAPGETVTITFNLRNTGGLSDHGSLSLPIPVHLAFADGLSASSGTAAFSGGVVTWQGDLLAGTVVTVQFNAIVDPSLSNPTPIHIQAELQGNSSTVHLGATIIVNGLNVYLPLIKR